MNKLLALFRPCIQTFMDDGDRISIMSKRSLLGSAFAERYFPRNIRFTLLLPDRVWHLCCDVSEAHIKGATE